MKDFLHHFQSKQTKVNKGHSYQTQCPFCSVQCTMQLTEEPLLKNKHRKVVGTANPTSKSRLCVKGRHAHQHHFNQQRITSPMLRKDGDLTPVTWDEAYTFIRDQFNTIQERCGRDAIGVYGGGSLTNEEAYLLGKFARVTLQTRYIDYNGRFCMSSAASAANDAFGIDRGFTNKLTELSYTRCLILAGTNIAECQPTLMPYLNQAKENGAFIIAIDPRETKTTALSDLHLKVKPGMDATLVNGLLKTIVTEGLTDSTFIETRTHGYESMISHLNSVDVDEVAQLTDIPIDSIKQAATLFAEAPTGMILTARGVEQHAHGYDTVRNFLNLLLITSKIGRIGCGYGAVTGQGNGQGGREHGQKSDQLPGYRSIENPEHRNDIADVWGIDATELPRKGVSAYEMIEKIDQKEITGLFVMGSNPVVSNPNAHFVESALKKLECLIVVDLFESETAQLADLVLPTSSYLEDEGTMTNLEGRVTLRQSGAQPPDGVKHDWELLRDISSVYGRGSYFPYDSPEDIFNELCKASQGGVADYSGITYDRLKDDRIYWPCPDPQSNGIPRLFEDHFYTTDGKAHIKPIASHRPKEDVSTEFPLYLTTGRVLQHYLTGVQTRHSPGLRAKSVQPFVQIHSGTAKQYGLQNNALVKLTSKRGEITLRCQFDDGIRQDTLFVPFHWGGRQCINRLTHDALDPKCRMPSFKICSVHIQSIGQPH